MDTWEPKVRKRIVTTTCASAVERNEDALDIPELATILLTSEDPDHPIDHIFNKQQNPGGRRWIAADPGEQYLILDFDKPQNLRLIVLEIEEPERNRSQDLTLSVSTDGGRTYHEIIRQEFNFSPPGTSYEKEQWAIAEQRVTHLCLRIVPDKHGGEGRASISSLVLS
jgi:F5/8 type C domain-containing protein